MAITRPVARTSSRPITRRVPDPRPIQFTPFSAGHFSTPEGLAFVNLQFSQMVNALNRNTGQAGPVVLPAGLDMAGGRVTGLGNPEHPSDAISSGHAQSQFSPKVIAPQLDLGGSSALTGLTNLQLLLTQGFTGTIPLTKLTGGGANGSITVKGGLIQSVVEPT